MALPAIVVSHTVAVAALKEGLSLCQSIMNYKLQTQQVELQRAHMHVEANIAMQKLEKDHQAGMAKLNMIANAHQITLKSIKSSSANHMEMIQSRQLDIKSYLDVIVSPDVSEDIKQTMMTVISQLSKEQTELTNSYIQNSHAPVDAFVVLMDGLRDNNQSRTFTDVS